MEEARMKLNGYKPNNVTDNSATGKITAFENTFSI